MQHKSDSRRHFSDFSDRTDVLANKLGLRIVDLPVRLGMSADMVMGYRTGRYPISAKAWRKLETAETAAGIAALPSRILPQNLPPGRPMIKDETASPPAKPQTKFQEYLAFIRACRIEAESLAGGDIIKAQDIFDRLLATWIQDAEKSQPAEDA